MPLFKTSNTCICIEHSVSGSHLFAGTSFYVVNLLLPPRRLCFHRRLFVCKQNYAKITQHWFLQNSVERWHKSQERKV